MISDRQIAANRRNAPLSKGRMSDEGKATVSGNALRHGLTSKRVVLADEDPEAYAAHRAALIEQFNPATPVEADLVDQVAQNHWRLLRALRVETGMFSAELAPLPRRDPKHQVARIPDRAAEVFFVCSAEFDKLRRYMTSIQRAYYKTLDTLEKMQKERISNTIGTVSQNRVIKVATSASSTPSAPATLGTSTSQYDFIPLQAPESYDSPHQRAA